MDFRVLCFPLQEVCPGRSDGPPAHGAGADRLVPGAGRVQGCGPGLP